MSSQNIGEKSKPEFTGFLEHTKTPIIIGAEEVFQIERYFQDPENVSEVEWQDYSSTG